MYKTLLTLMLLVLTSYTYATPLNDQCNSCSYAEKKAKAQTKTYNSPAGVYDVFIFDFDSHRFSKFRTSKTIYNDPFDPSDYDHITLSVQARKPSKFERETFVELDGLESKFTDDFDIEGPGSAYGYIGNDAHTRDLHNWIVENHYWMLDWLNGWVNVSAAFGVVLGTGQYDYTLKVVFEDGTSLILHMEYGELVAVDGKFKDRDGNVIPLHPEDVNGQTYQFGDGYDSQTGTYAQSFMDFLDRLEDLGLWNGNGNGGGMSCTFSCDGEGTCTLTCTTTSIGLN